MNSNPWSRSCDILCSNTNRAIWTTEAVIESDRSNTNSISAVGSPRLETASRFLAATASEPQSREPEGVTRELGARADKGLGPYTSLIKAAFMGGFAG